MKFCFLFLILFSPIVIHGGAIYINSYEYINEVGKDFVDEFHEEDYTQWKILEGLTCLGEDPKLKIKYKCARRDKGLIQYLHAPPKKNFDRGQSELNIILRNDCEGPECCKENGAICTSIRTGQVISKLPYTYGTFRFQMRTIASCLNYEPEEFCHEQPWKFKDCGMWAMRGECITNPNYMQKCCKAECGICDAGDRSGSIWDVLSCVSLQEKGDIHETGKMVITACVPSLRPNELIHIWQYGNEVSHQRIRMPFNAGRWQSLYRIDWYPDRIEWYNNGRLLTIARAAKYKIPNVPLYIRMYTLPQARQGVGDELDEMELRMRIFKVRYRRFTNVTDAPVYHAPLPDKGPPGPPDAPLSPEWGSVDEAIGKDHMDQDLYDDDDDDDVKTELFISSRNLSFGFHIILVLFVLFMGIILIVWFIWRINIKMTSGCNDGYILLDAESDMSYL